LEVRKVLVNGSLANQSYGIGFFQSQGASDGAGGVKSSNQTVQMYYVTSFATSAPFGTIKTRVHLGGLSVASQVTICLSDDQQYATITLGTNSNKLAASVQRHGKTKPLTC
jgi:hypothetical protein